MVLEGLSTSDLNGHRGLVTVVDPAVGRVSVTINVHRDLPTQDQASQPQNRAPAAVVCTAEWGRKRVCRGVPASAPPDGRETATHSLPGGALLQAHVESSKWQLAGHVVGRSSI